MLNMIIEPIIPSFTSVSSSNIINIIIMPKIIKHNDNVKALFFLFSFVNFLS